MKNIVKKYVAPILIIISIILFIVYNLIDINPHEDIKKVTFSKLGKIRESKKQQISDYFSNIIKVAEGLKDDNFMIRYFYKIKNDKYWIKPEFEYEINKHFVSTYSNFYDILFVDPTGFVFYSIKQESDYQKNLFEGELANTELSKLLKQSIKETFVGYDFYFPSDEPAAFYTIPLYKNNQHSGWFVVQCPINKVNTILTDRENLGRTGEVYLVDTKKMMLSDSRFIEDDTILKKKVDTKAVKDALDKGNGENIIEDYRGVRVYSSYEKFELFGVNWIIIVEIDEDEVITEYYKQHKKYFQENIYKYLANKQHPKYDQIEINQRTKRIDLYEFMKAMPGTILQTNGVSECTAFTVSYLNRFVYMAHIPPTDEIYISDPLTKLFLGDRSSDFVSELIKKTMYYDVYPYEFKQLHFMIIASHNNSFGKSVDKILDKNVELANIKFLYNPKANGANIFFDVTDGSAKVEWYFNNFTYWEHSSDYEDLGTILKKIIKYDT